MYGKEKLIVLFKSSLVPVVKNKSATIKRQTPICRPDEWYRYLGASGF
jgi:hypothetical protein